MALLLTAAIVPLHWILFSHAGGLWRDEIGIVNISRMPGWAQVWEFLPHDHCPIVLPALLRGWSGLSWGASDHSLRAFGLLVGLLLVATLWGVARTVWRGVPLLALGFFALNPIAVRYGDSIRAYGLGSVFMVLTLACAGRYVERPSWKSAALTAIAAILSVQTLYQNAFFVLAICVAGFVVLARRGRPRPAAGMFAIGAIAALSLVQYIRPLRESQSWWVVEKTPISSSIIWRNVSAATGAPFHWLSLLWILLLVCGIALEVRRRARSKDEWADGSSSDRAREFVLLALLIGVCAFFVFVGLAHLQTQPWYYLPLLAFIIVCCDALLSQASGWLRIALLAIALVPVFGYGVTVTSLEIRQTNGDMVASQVAQLAAPEDLIVVHPWYFGVTFSRNYQGKAAWLTLPPLGDYHLHRYDLLKQQLAQLHPAEPVFRQVAATLESGHKVWVVGALPVLPAGQPVPQDLPPAPNPLSGWYDEPYSNVWGVQLSSFLIAHAASAEIVPQASSARINPLEDMRVIGFSGWRGAMP